MTNHENLKLAVLDAIPEDTRWTIANALRSAATKWDEWAGELAVKSVAESFAKQAVEARALAEQFENY